MLWGALYLFVYGFFFCFLLHFFFIVNHIQNIRITKNHTESTYLN